MRMPRMLNSDLTARPTFWSRRGFVQRQSRDQVRGLSFVFVAKIIDGDKGTACCVTISGSTLRAANLGDSGFLVVRDGSLLHRQQEQQHGYGKKGLKKGKLFSLRERTRFNFPFQLGTGSTDGPDDAECVELQLQEGDVVVVKKIVDAFFVFLMIKKRLPLTACLTIFSRRKLSRLCARA